MDRATAVQKFYALDALRSAHGGKRRSRLVKGGMVPYEHSGRWLTSVLNPFLNFCIRTLTNRGYLQFFQVIDLSNRHNLFYLGNPGAVPVYDEAGEFVAAFIAAGALEGEAIVESGKVKHVGLSEVGPDWLCKAHAVHPVSAVQQEWSLLTRNLEDSVVPACKKLGVGIVAYSPLARNLLCDPAEAPKDWRQGNPRYSEENFAKNKELVAKIKAMAAKKERTAAQLSLAWLYHKARILGVSMIPIPGTTKAERAAENFAAQATELSDEEIAELEALGSLVAGPRGNEQYLQSGIEAQLGQV